jgi:uncharacterized protein (DUF983 family)
MGLSAEKQGGDVFDVGKFERRKDRVTANSKGVMLSRAWRLQCPRCGKDRLFTGWFRMSRQCRHCGLKYERGPGYFLGSIYVNYGLTSVITTVTYVTLHFGAGLDNQLVAWPLAVFCVLFPMFFFRYARAYWLAMDCYFDTTDLDEPSHAEEES